MPAAHDCVLPDVLQYSGYTPTVRVQLYRRPRVVLWILGVIYSGIFSLNTNETAVAISQALPSACAGMVSPTRRNDIKRPVPAQTKLCKRPWEISTPVDEHREARHIPSLWPGGVVTYYPFNRADFAATAVWPAVNFGDLETSVPEHSR
jgi:hypothetical protein